MTKVKITKFDKLRKGDRAKFRFPDDTKMTGRVGGQFDLNKDMVWIHFGDLNERDDAIISAWADKKYFVSATRELRLEDELPVGSRVRARFLKGVYGVVEGLGSRGRITVRWDDDSRSDVWPDAVRKVSLQPGDVVDVPRGATFSSGRTTDRKYTGTVVRLSSDLEKVTVRVRRSAQKNAARFWVFRVSDVRFVSPAPDDRMREAVKKLDAASANLRQVMDMLQAAKDEK